MPLDFPSSPNIGDTWTGSNGVDYVWDGTKWVSYGTAGGSGAFATKPYVDARIVSVLDHGAFGNGTTDDTAAINNTLASYAGKASVFIPDTGNPYMVTQLNVPSNTTLLLDGTLLIRAGTNIGGSGVLDMVNQSNIRISGYGTVDGNDPTNAGNAISAGINAYTVTNLRVSGITLQNAHHWNINVTGSQNVILYGVTMIGGGNANEFAAGSDNCWLMNCTIEDIHPDFGFAFYGGVTNSGAIGNTMRSTNVGIFVLADAGQTAPCKNILIAKNIVYNSDATGIAVDLSAPGLHESVTITGNRVYDSNASGQAGQQQIYLGAVRSCIVSDNMLSALEPLNECAYGIHTSASTDVVITGNCIIGAGSSTEAGFGVWVNSSDAVLVEGNTFHDYRTPAFMTAIGGIAGVWNRYTNNLFGRLAGPPVTIVLQPDTITDQVPGVPGVNAANDAAAQAAGVAVGGRYRNGSALMVRVT